MLNYTTLVRNTRGKSSREVTFEGIQTETALLDDNGGLVLNKANERVLVPVGVDTLPTVAEAFEAICSQLENDTDKIRFILAKTLNSVCFAIRVAATATVVEDAMTPILIAAGVTDEKEQTKFKRTASMFASMSGIDPIDALNMSLELRAKAIAQ